MQKIRFRKEWRRMRCSARWGGRRILFPTHDLHLFMFFSQVNKPTRKPVEQLAKISRPTSSHPSLYHNSSPFIVRFLFLSFIQCFFLISRFFRHFYSSPFFFASFLLKLIRKELNCEKKMEEGKKWRSRKCKTKWWCRRRQI